MYVIGKSEYELIKISKNDVMCDGKNLWTEIKCVEYNTSLLDATIINCYDKAVDILNEIQENVNDIRFTNYSIIDNIIDKENSFDKIEYSKQLKIFELIPTLVETKKEGYAHENKHE